MFLSSFWQDHWLEISVSTVFVLASIALLVALVINIGKQETSKKVYVIGSFIFALVLFSVNFFIYKDYKNALSQDPTTEFPLANVFAYNALIIIAFSLVGYLVISRRNKEEEKMTVANVAMLSLLVALSTVLMLFGIPILPGFTFLKVEISALIYFLVYLWFGIKPTTVVIFLTNIIHAIMPSFGVQIVPGLDQMVNVIAVFTFLFPSFIAFRKLEEGEVPPFKSVLVCTIIGVVFTSVFMLLYNYFINLPLIYGMNMSFEDVLKIFGLFNIIKWSTVSAAIVLLYKKLYELKNQLVR